MTRIIECHNCCGSGQIFADEHILIEETEIQKTLACPVCLGDGVREEDEEEDFEL